MKNKTLTLILSIILLTSVFTACGKVVEKEIKMETEVRMQSAARSTEIDDIDINQEALNKAISKSILKTTERLDKSELSTEGHILLGTDTEKNILKAYVIAAVSNYGIQNDILTCISRTSATPVVISYQVNPENHRYTETDYREVNPENTIENLFPEQYHQDAKNPNDYYLEIEAMQIEQAKEYLDFIDRDLPIKPLIEKEAIPILTNSNFSKQAPNFPTWEGSSEVFENGQRFIYTSEIQESENGNYIIICKKTNENGDVIMSFSVDETGTIKQLDEN